MRCLALLLVILLVAFMASDVEAGKNNNKPGCPAGHKPGDKWDQKPGCSQCICNRSSDTHFCRDCSSVRTYNIPGRKAVFDNTRSYPTCCYPNYVKI